MSRQILGLSFGIFFLFLNACAESQSGSESRRPQDPAPIPPGIVGDIEEPDEQLPPTDEPSEGEQDGDQDNNDESALSFLQPIGAVDQLEVATWNLENFPKSELSLTYVTEIIKRIDIDLIALQEVASVEAMNEMLRSLPQYEVVLSTHAYGNGSYQKVGFLYKKQTLELVGSRLLFTDDSYAFPRPPLQAEFRYRAESREQQEAMTAIVVHLKASRDESARRRREEAHNLLEAYVSNLLESSQTPISTVVLGDFNETMNDAVGSRVHKPWLDEDQTYFFPTLDAANNGEYSFISSSKSLIDHMILSQTVAIDRVDIPKIHLKFRDYREQVSDHLPVIGTVSGF